VWSPTPRQRHPATSPTPGECSHFVRASSHTARPARTVAAGQTWRLYKASKRKEQAPLKIISVEEECVVFERQWRSSLAPATPTRRQTTSDSGAQSIVVVKKTAGSATGQPRTLHGVMPRHRSAFDPNTAGQPTLTAGPDGYCQRRRDKEPLVFELPLSGRRLERHRAQVSSSTHSAPNQIVIVAPRSSKVGHETPEGSATRHLATLQR